MQAAREILASPARICFLGNVKVYRADGMPPLYRLLVGQPAKLQFEPHCAADLEGAGTAPFYPSDRFDLSLMNPAGAVEVTHSLSLDSPLFTPVPLGPKRLGHVLARVPSAAQSSEASPHFLFPNRTGLWTLRVDWEAPSQLSQKLPFWVHSDPLEDPDVEFLWRQILDSQAAASDGEALVEQCLSRSGNPATVLWTLLELCRDRLWRHAEWPAMERLGLAAVELAKQTGFVSEEARAWTIAHEGARESAAGEDASSERAEAYLSKALEVDEAFELRFRLPLELFDLGMLQRSRGRPLEALETIRQARWAAESTLNQKFTYISALGEIDLLYDLGHVTTVKSRLDDLTALKDWQPGVEDTPILTDYAWLLLQLVESGTLSTAEAQAALLRAEDGSLRAIKAYEEREDWAALPNEWADLSCIHSLMGRFHEAEACVEKIEDLGREGRGLLQEGANALVTLVQGRILRARGKEREALARLEQAVLMAERAAWPLGAGTACYEIGETLFASGERFIALEAYDRALKFLIQDSTLRSPLHGADVLSCRPLWEARATAVRIELSQVKEALEHSNQRVWRRGQMLRRARGLETLEEHERRSYDELEAEIEKAESLLHPLRMARSLDEVRGRRLKQQEMHLIQLREKQELLFATGGRDEPQPLILDELSEALGADSLLLYLEIFPEFTVCWELSQTQGIQARKVGQRAETLFARIAAYTDSIRLKGNIDAELGEKLGRALLGRYFETPPRRIFIAPSGSLSAIPWVALRTRQGFLVESTDVCHLPDLCDRSRRLDRGAFHPLLLCNPTRDLRAAHAEGRYLEKRFAPWTAGAEHTQSSPSELIEDLREVTLFHFSGHGVSDTLLPITSHLRLAQGARLGLMELRRLTFTNAPDVVLHACDSANAPREGGRVMALSEAFLAAGARSVLASRWPVADGQACYRFTEQLYERWRPESGECSLLEAFADTQRLFARDKKYAGAPYVWSGYALLAASLSSFGVGGHDGSGTARANEASQE